MPGVLIGSKLARIGEKAGAVTKQREWTRCGQRKTEVESADRIRSPPAGRGIAPGKTTPDRSEGGVVTFDQQAIKLGFACLLNIPEQRSGRWFQTGFLSVQTYPDGLFCSAPLHCIGVRLRTNGDPPAAGRTTHRPLLPDVQLLLLAVWGGHL